MAIREEITLQNFVSGEMSKRMYGRYELPVFRNGLRRGTNFILETQGSGVYRAGTVQVTRTRNDEIASLAPFQFNDEQAYQIAFTEKKARFFRNEGVILEASQTVTVITEANPGVITVTGHNFATDDEIFIDIVADAALETKLDLRYFRVVFISANTFSLLDLDGVAVDTTGLGAFTSGTVARVYEVDSPYVNTLSTTLTDQLFKTKYTQNADTMYLFHSHYEPRKLTRTGHTNFTLDIYTRTNDPFTDKKVITDVTNANPGVITSAGHLYTGGETIILEEIEGTVELNSQPYLLVFIDVNTFSLTDLDGNAIDTTAFGVYTANGYASNQNLIPSAGTLYESRLWAGGTPSNPDKIFGSRAPEGPTDPNPGDSRYDDFTTGTNADDSVRFTVADSEVNKILWLAGTDRSLMSGTFGSEIKIIGEDLEKAITPTSVQAKAINRLGVENVAPVNRLSDIFYVQRGGLKIKSLGFNALDDRFVSENRNLVSDHITKSGVKQMSWMTGEPDILWCVKNDGQIITLTVQDVEDISGWTRQITGLTEEDEYVSVSMMGRPSAIDQPWFVVKRTIGGNDRRFIEFLSDQVDFSERIDFFTGVENKALDDIKFELTILEELKGHNHLDCMLEFDGSALGLAAGATMTPAALTGDTVNFTASAAVFTSTAVDLDKEIWKKAIKGVGTGRARIVSITSPTVAVCKILDGADFDTLTAMPAGDWFLTSDTVGNLDHIEGREASILVDGGVHPKKTITNGAITLDFQASNIKVGLGYDGLLMPMALEFGGSTGPAPTKEKIMRTVAFVLSDTLGLEVGTDLYKPDKLPFLKAPIPVGKPTLPFTGVKKIPITDRTEQQKIMYARQRNPLPARVQLIQIYGETDNDEG